MDGGELYELADPSEVGIDPNRLDELRARVAREVEEGLLPSCQVALAKDGRLVLFETYGKASPNSRYVVYSVTKGVIAAAVWILVSEGLVEWSTRVCEIVPGFSTGGKQKVTIEHLLTHTAGFPYAPLWPEDGLDKKKRAEAFATWRVQWEPGTRFEYHPTSAHWVLADILERLSGEDYREFVRRQICAPLGLRWLRLGEPPERQGDINRPTLVGEPPSPAEIKEVLGVEIDVSSMQGPITEDVLVQLGRPDLLEIGIPGGGAVSNAADIALFYQALLRRTEEIWDPEVVQEGIEPVCDLPDPLRGLPCHRSRGLIVAGDPPGAQYRGFGYGCSSRTFGHDGAGGQIAWADPDSGISLCYLTDGLDRNFVRQGRRSVGISSRAASVIATEPQFENGAGGR